MKQLKEYIKEGLFDDVDKLEGKNSFASNTKQLKKEIVDWISNNYYSSHTRKNNYKLKKRAIEVDTSTTPPTVNCKVDLYTNKLISLNNNGMFQWGKVDGCFDCQNCYDLKSIEGAPKEVDMFTCNDCSSLKSLKGAPEKIGDYFSCGSCKLLTSLEGCPKEICGKFNCTSLTSFKGAPKEVGEDFTCYNCGGQFTEEDVKKVSNVKGEIYI